MNYQAHRVGGVCAATVVATTVFNGHVSEIETIIPIGLAILGGSIGGLLPDIDHPTSKVGLKVPPISKTINALFGHRGFTHTLLALLLFTYFLIFIGCLFPISIRGYLMPLFMGMSIGYGSHLLLDMLTISGIPLFYPLSNQSVRMLKLRSGRDDLLVSIVMISCTGLYLYIIGSM